MARTTPSAASCTVAREKFDKNVQAQGQVFKAIQEGLQEAGKTL